MQSPGRSWRTSQLLQTIAILPSSDLQRVQYLSIPTEFRNRWPGVTMEKYFWCTLLRFTNAKQVSVLKELDRYEQGHGGKCQIRVPGGSCFPETETLNSPVSGIDANQYYFTHNKSVIARFLGCLQQLNWNYRTDVSPGDFALWIPPVFIHKTVCLQNIKQKEFLCPYHNKGKAQAQREKEQKQREQREAQMERDEKDIVVPWADKLTNRQVQVEKHRLAKARQ